MIVTSVKYQKYMNETSDVVKAIIDSDEIFVPIDAEGNRHWQAIQAWVADGNTIDSAD